MKKVLLAAVVLGLCSMAVCAPLHADTFDVSAEVPTSSPTLTVTLLSFTDGNTDGDPWTNSSPATGMDFGLLTYRLADNSNAGAFFSNTGICAIIVAEGFGAPYEVRSSCDGITSGADSLPAGSFGMTPVYSETDKWVYPGGSANQGTMPAGAVLGSAGPAVTQNALIYSSESGTSTARIIQVYYGISPKKAGGADPFPGYVAIPLTQKPGRYSGNVIITLSLK